MNKANQPSSFKGKAGKNQRRGQKRTVLAARAYIFASFNNTIIMIADNQGNALGILSAGACGFRGSKKGTAHAAQIATHQIADRMINTYGIKKLDIFVRGIGQGRDSAIRTLLNKNFRVERITDKTTIAHGGVRPRKARRV